MEDPVDIQIKFEVNERMWYLLEKKKTPHRLANLRNVLNH